MKRELMFKPPYFREWRKYRGMTLGQAAPLANMTAGNLSAMERNEQGYTQAGIEGLARAYGCKPVDLFRAPIDHSEIGTLFESADERERDMIVEIAKVIIRGSRSKKQTI